MTYQQHRCSYLHLTLGTENGDQIRGSFLVRETELRIRLPFDIVDEDTLLAKQRTMILARNGDGLIDVVLVLDEMISISGS